MPNNLLIQRLQNLEYDVSYLVKRLTKELENTAKPFPILSDKEIEFLYFEKFDGYFTIEEVTKFIRIVESFQKTKNA